MSQSKLSASSIETWFVMQLAEQMSVDVSEIDAEDRFDSFALDSAKLMLIGSRAEKMLGFQISPSQLWLYPTIRGLSERLAEEATSMENDLIKGAPTDLIASILADVEKLTKF
jgi:acyl carrier protein